MRKTTAPQWQYYLLLIPILVSSQDVERKTVNGEVCEFPFSFEGVLRTDCAAWRGVEWCKATNGLWAICQPRSDAVPVESGLGIEGAAVEAGGPGTSTVQLPEGQAAVADGVVVINEVKPGGVDQWIELANLGSEPASLIGWQLRGAGSATVFELGAEERCRIPQLTRIPPGGFLKQTRLRGPCSFSFPLAREAGSVQLLDPSGAVADTLSWNSPVPTGSSLARPEGGGEARIQDPTPGRSNAGVPVQDDTFIQSVLGQGQDCCSALAAVGFQSNLPVMIVNTAGKQIPDEPKLDGVFMCTCSNFDDYAGKIGIEIRGSTSARDHDKKSFGVELRKEDGIRDKKVSLLGLPEEEDWVLYGPEQDFTMGMRNVITFQASRALGQYASRHQFFEMFLVTDGQALSQSHYHGIYVLLEKIKRNRNRLDIAGQDSAAAAGGYPWLLGSLTQEQLSGGYAMKYENDNIDPWDVTFRLPLSGLTFIMVYPDTNNGVTDAQVNWLADYMNQFEEALFGAGFTGPQGYQNYIDQAAFIDYFLVVEMTKNPDGYRGSTYMHKDRGGPLRMGPVWDYNEAYGLCCGYPIAGFLDEGRSDGLSGGSAISPNGWRFNICQEPERCLVDPVDGISQWYQRMWEDTAFRRAVSSRWQQVRGSLLTNGWLNNQINSMVTELSGAAARNFERWKDAEFLRGRVWEREVQLVRTWLLEHVAWMDAELAGASTPAVVLNPLPIAG